MKYQDDQHFSHHHVLQPLRLDEGERVNCSACEEIITEPFHGCLKCHHFLHDYCLSTPRSLEHPCHPSHPLTLLPTPTYSSRGYSCNACGSAGGAFSYSCAHCEFDLHLQCASLPTTVKLEKHPHELKLLFGSPYKDKDTVFGCDICRATMHKDFWLYYCAECDFGSHTHCANGKPSLKSQPKVGETQPELPEVELIKRVSDAQNKVYAAQIQAHLQARGAQGALDLVGPSYERRYYY